VVLIVIVCGVGVADLKRWDHDMVLDFLLARAKLTRDEVSSLRGSAECRRIEPILRMDGHSPSARVVVSEEYLRSLKLDALDQDTVKKELELLSKMIEPAEAKNEPFLHVSTTGIDPTQMMLDQAKGLVHVSAQTGGIDPSQFEIESKDGAIVSVELVDMAGQAEYYIGHQMFLSDIQCLYLVVAEYKKQEGFQSWLPFLKAMFDENTRVPAMLVATKLPRVAELDDEAPSLSVYQRRSISIARSRTCCCMTWSATRPEEIVRARLACGSLLSVACGRSASRLECRWCTARP